MPEVNTDTTDTRLIDFIDKMKLSNGSVVWLGDNWAREKIEALTNPLQYLGKTTTDITTEPGKSSPTITIGGESITASEGGIVLYDMTIAGKTTTIEAIWNGSVWEEFGSRGTLGTFAFVDYGKGSITYTDTKVGQISIPTIHTTTTISEYAIGSFLNSLDYTHGLDSIRLNSFRVLTVNTTDMSDITTTVQTTNATVNVAGTATVTSANILISTNSAWTTYTTDGKLSINVAGGGASFSGTTATLATQKTVYYGVFASVSNTNGVVGSERAHWATYQPQGSVTFTPSLSVSTSLVYEVGTAATVAVKSWQTSVDTTDSHMLVFSVTTTSPVVPNAKTIVVGVEGSSQSTNLTGTTSYFRSKLEWTNDATSTRFDGSFIYAAMSTSYTPEGEISGITGEATAYLKMPAQSASVAASGTYIKATGNGYLDSIQDQAQLDAMYLRAGEAEATGYYQTITTITADRPTVTSWTQTTTTVSFVVTPTTSSTI